MSLRIPNVVVRRGAIVAPTLLNSLDAIEDTAEGDWINAICTRCRQPLGDHVWRLLSDGSDVRMGEFCPEEAP